MRDAYDTNDLQRLFGSAWCGPATLEHAENTLLAKLPKTCPEGFDVEVYCAASPARFYEVRATSEAGVSFALKTDSGMSRFVMEFAKLATEGMLDVRSAELATRE